MNLMLTQKKIHTLILLLTLIGGVQAQQDAVFSQFYANPLYLNPALAGNGDCMRAIVSYRNQYPNIPDTYINYNLGIDGYLPFLHGGIGILLESDRKGNDTFVTNNISGIYAYQMMLSSHTALNAGFQIHYRQYSFQGNDLIFQDMIDHNSGLVNPVSGDIGASGFSSRNIDYSAGMFFDFSEKYFLGISAHHLTEISTPYYPEDNKNYLKRKYSIHGGMNIPLYMSYYRMQLSPNFIVQLQNEILRINGGFNFTYWMFTAGLWYHNVKNTSESLIGIIGINTGKIKLGYSYDFVLSGLSGASGGSHEISLSYHFLCVEKKHKKNTINCPEF
jgi:type IX secretion system PorP/SprF family membrane protein